MSHKDNKPTMKDVAAEAGVALGTVSKVINGLPVGQEYRDRVEAAIRKLNYEVNTYAQALKTSRTYCLALIIPNASNPYFAALVNEVTRCAAENGYRLILCLSDYSTLREQELVDIARRNKADGIIGLTYNPSLIVPDDIPFVAIDRYLGPDIPCITSDNYGGGRIAAEKLISLGCRRLLFMRIGSRLASEPNRRRDGFLDACEAHGIACDMKILGDGEPLEQFTEYLKAHMKDGRLEYDGIFCVTDFLAYRVRLMLRSLGINVPGDVQLIGFDGVRMFGDQEYTCSTIVQPVRGIARSCVDILTSGPDAVRPSQIQLPVTYAPGGTTKE